MTFRGAQLDRWTNDRGTQPLLLNDGPEIRQMHRAISDSAKEIPAPVSTDRNDIARRRRMIESPETSRAANRTIGQTIQCAHGNGQESEPRIPAVSQSSRHPAQPRDIIIPAGPLLVIVTRKPRRRGGPAYTRSAPCAYHVPCLPTRSAHPPFRASNFSGEVGNHQRAQDDCKSYPPTRKCFQLIQTE